MLAEKFSRFLEMLHSLLCFLLISLISPAIDSSLKTDSSLAVFSPGSSHPASVLYDALEHFDNKSPKADEAIRSIRPDLAGAVDTCIEAAGREVDSYWQKRLLKVCFPALRGIGRN